MVIIFSNAVSPIVDHLVCINFLICLWGVGRNHRGQLGDGTVVNKKVPVKIMDGVAKAFASSSGFFSACITTDGKLLTWGDNSMGQLGREAGKYASKPGETICDI